MAAREPVVYLVSIITLHQCNAASRLLFHRFVFDIHSTPVHGGIKPLETTNTQSHGGSTPRKQHDPPLVADFIEDGVRVKPILRVTLLNPEVVKNCNESAESTGWQRGDCIRWREEEQIQSQDYGRDRMKGQVGRQWQLGCKVW